MSRLSRGLILLVGLVLTLSLAVSLKTRRELLAAAAANDFLRKTLGDMTVAITTKDREINRLKLAGCNEQEKPWPGVSGTPDRSRISKSDVVSHEDDQRLSTARADLDSQSITDSNPHF
jgi:hypothetical protein